MQVKETTPMMQQWHACKEKAKGALLLFRLGDFYEAFHEDAAILAKEIEVTLTKRQGIPMSGIPVHAAEAYIDKLIAKGHLVAIAEQVEDPKNVKGIVKREVVRLLSKGAVYNPSLLSEKTNNFFLSLAKVNSLFGLAAIDLTTGECRATELSDIESLRDELFRLKPSELLVSHKLYLEQKSFLDSLKENLSFRISLKENWHYEHKLCSDFLTKKFSVHNLDGFGLKDRPAALLAAGSLLCHFEEELSINTDHVLGIESYSLSCFMQIDQMTQKNLELFASTSAGEPYTLLHLLDHTKTPMGGRLLKQWLARPLISLEEIQKRQVAANELKESSFFAALQQTLSFIYDLERLILRIKAKQNSPKDLVSLKDSLKAIPQIKELLTDTKGSVFTEITSSFFNTKEITDKIETILVEDPPIKTGDKELIRKGVNIELDELKDLKAHSEDFLVKYQEKLKNETGIKTLKVGYSRSFGYFIDISRGNAKNVPLYFHKRQTLVNNERFTTEELREYEHKILTAEEKIQKIELSLYDELVNFILNFESLIRSASKGISILDCLASFAKLSKNEGYIYPEMQESDLLFIKDGRHPVIETLDLASTFIPNDVDMDTQSKQLFVITGPNMAGKSTYIRQVALLTIMAQIGAPIPAKAATIGIIDKVFSRIGASDDLARGQSTFMVEMAETANILRHATRKSLVILDEIGRGTSTYDGISIASAVAEYLLTTIKAKTLFATHYFELTDLEMKMPGALNYNICVQETSTGIVFLRKIQRGSADKSYGIHVAKLAGLPTAVIKRAESLLKDLEKAPSKPLATSKQMLLFSEQQPPEKVQVLEEIKALDVAHLTPMQALLQLQNWQNLLK